jgi:hypothetical protein
MHIETPFHTQGDAYTSMVRYISEDGTVCFRAMGQELSDGREKWTGFERLVSGRVFDHTKKKKICTTEELRRCTFIGTEDLTDVKRVLRMMEKAGFIVTVPDGKELIIVLTEAGQAIANSGKIY